MRCNGFERMDIQSRNECVVLGSSFPERTIEDENENDHEDEAGKKAAPLSQFPSGLQRQADKANLAQGSYKGFQLNLLLRWSCRLVAA